jgi:hypothetical protein
MVWATFWAISHKLIWSPWHIISRQKVFFLENKQNGAVPTVRSSERRRFRHCFGDVDVALFCFVLFCRISVTILATGTSHITYTQVEEAPF